MKLIRFGEPGGEKPGVLLPDGRRKDLSAYFQDWDHEFFQNQGLFNLQDLVDEEQPSMPEAPAGARLGPPVARPGKIVAVGLNYREHVAESGAQIPSEPVLFSKAANCVVGPDDEVVIPRGSQRTDWEVELAVILASAARYLDSPEAAAECVAGYCIANDVSERDYQRERGGQWVKGKSSDTFCPLGPWLVTPDEIDDVGALSLSLDLNGERMQNGNSGDMIFGVFHLTYYISQFMTLEPGDVILTGTPPGVGLGRGRYLRPGDEMRLRIDGLGEQHLRCVAAP